MVERGIAVYDIFPEGILNGRYTNEFEDGTLYNENARRLTSTNEDSLAGNYSCSWEERDRHVEGSLQIVRRADTVYSFRWDSSDGNSHYIGLGIMSSDNQIAVSYRQVNA